MPKLKICHIHPYTSPPSAAKALGGAMVMESLIKGQLSLGHEVYMKINSDSKSSPAPMVDKVPDDCDILHFHTWNGDESERYFKSFGKPWIALIGGVDVSNPPEWYDSVQRNKGNIIAVSKFIQDKIGCSGYAWNCSHPDDFIYNDKKEDYFLWIGGTDWGENKGIFSMIAHAKKLKFRLKIAGSGSNSQIIGKIKSLCDEKINYVGAVSGRVKAELLSNAKGLILLTKLPDACPTVVSEALLSGTPIIGSNFGSMPELIREDVGYICSTEKDFVKAVLRIKKLNPKDCYEYGLKYFSSNSMAKKCDTYYREVMKNV